MSAKAGLLEHILAHPDDDTSRLVYADWLEENGELDRATFIRTQVERAALAPWDALQAPLRAREHDLLKRNEVKWKAELPKIKGVTWGVFRRGFVSGVVFASFDVLKKKAAACWAATPLEGISIVWPGARETVDDIAPIPQLRELFIETMAVTYEEVHRLANAPLLSTLQTLHLRQCSLGVDGFNRIVASPHLANLRALRVPLNTIGNGGVEFLVRNGALKNLEELDLSEAGSYGRYEEDPVLDVVGITALARWPGLRKLKGLILTGNDIGREGLRALLRSKEAQSLKSLGLRRNGLKASAMEEFRSAHEGLKLDALDLGENLLREMGPRSLRGSNCLDEAKVLLLDRCEMSVSSAISLSESPFLQTLRRLNVSENSLGPKGLRAILERKPSELHTLGLADNDLRDEGAWLLADYPASAKLQDVDLSRNQMTDDTVEALVTSKNLGSLLRLRLRNNDISAPAAAKLAKSPLGQRLALMDAEFENEATTL